MSRTLNFANSFKDGHLISRRENYLSRIGCRNRYLNGGCPRKGAQVNLATIGVPHLRDGLIVAKVGHRA
jgi:hypothetical protein